MANNNIGGLWIKEGAKGKFMAGKINGEDVVIFKNGYKKEPKHPDYHVFLGRKRGDGGAVPTDGPPAASTARREPEKADDDEWGGW